MTAATLEAYERWAPIYPPTPHNPLMRAEQQAMLDRWPDVAGRRTLDLACGTGRYARLLTESAAAHVVALDFCEPMLQKASTAGRVRASMMHLPFVGSAFDVVISGLALSHAPSVQDWMTEIARVLGPDGSLLYSDFHPDAARAGLTRSFKDVNRRTCTVPHRCYSKDSQIGAAAQAGLTVETVHEVRVGFELREPFAKSEEFYRLWHGLPIVLVVGARKKQGCLL